MNKSNMYEFISKTWNPLGGECSHKCSFCYVTKMKQRFPVMERKYSGEPFIDNRQMNAKFKPGDTVFVCSCNDLFADNVPPAMIIKILEHCENYPETTFYFQSKNIDKMYKMKSYFPEDSIICTTAETNRWYMGIMGGLSVMDRLYWLRKMYFRTEITIEPIMDFDLYTFIELLKNSGASKINIGANSDKSIKLPEPTEEKILQLISELKKFTVVYQKSNLQRLVK